MDCFELGMVICNDVNLDFSAAELHIISKINVQGAAK